MAGKPTTQRYASWRSGPSTNHGRYTKIICWIGWCIKYKLYENPPSATSGARPKARASRELGATVPRYIREAAARPISASDLGIASRFGQESMQPTKESANTANASL